MSDDLRQRPEKNAGAFLGPDILAAVPLRTLSDEIPVGDPKPRPRRPGPIRRAIDRLLGRDLPS